MFVGHALLAFAVAALVADWRGWDPRRALFVGGVAGAFATIPDIDVAYALVGLLEWQLGDGALGASTAFWDASRGVHRSVTHSLVVGAVAAPAFGLLAVRGYSRRPRLVRSAGIAVLAALVAFAFVWDGPVGALVTGLFVASGGIIARAIARRSTLSAATVGVAALWGLWSHPWGDVVTGSPPDWVYPFGAPALESRVVLHADPTLHLLGAFGIELATIWFALAVAYRLTDRSIRASVDRRAGVGVAYGVAALAVTPPTLEVSYHFVFSILGVGLLCGVIRETPATTAASVTRRDRPELETLLEVGVTALAAVTVALTAFGAVYLVVIAP